MNDQVLISCGWPWSANCVIERIRLTLTYYVVKLTTMSCVCQDNVSADLLPDQVYSNETELLIELYSVD